MVSTAEGDTNPIAIFPGGSDHSLRLGRSRLLEGDALARRHADWDRRAIRTRIDTERHRSERSQSVANLKGHHRPWAINIAGGVWVKADPDFHDVCIR